MIGVREQFVINLRLYFRNTMALIYGYLFPAIFLLAFYVLYRYERVPLVRHMGELLTIAVLGGACFGLPTTLVNERERGVWRRYRLTPVPSFHMVASTLLSRYVILLTAGLLQLALAMALGMPLPAHPVDLFVVFSCVAFAFMGLGLVIAMMADNVPAVQALGQCIFLPMLIIGGVAVQLTSLPDWALHLSAFFPGRYAVEAIQACVNGNGLSAAGFAVLALVLIGAAGSLAGARMFRWDAQQRFAQMPGKAWLGVALAAWLAVGVMAELQGRVGALPPGDVRAARVATGAATGGTPLVGPRAGTDAAPPVTADPSVPGSPAPAAPIPAGSPTSGAAAATLANQGRQATSSAPPAGTASRGATATAPTTAAPAGPSAATAAAPMTGAPAAAVNAEAAPAAVPNRGGADATWTPPATWQDVTLARVDEDITYNRLPPDGGVVTPIAPLAEEPTDEAWDQIELIRQTLPTWAPGQVADPVQRVRNLLYVAAVPDVFQLPIERYTAGIVFAEIQRVIPKDTLQKVLYWIALHPEGGSDETMDDLKPFGIDPGVNLDEARNRTAIYAVKLLGHITGKRPLK